MPDKPEPPRPPRVWPPGTPPAAPADASIVDYLRRRLDGIERELLRERERASAAEDALKQREALRGEVETELKRLAEQFRQQKSVEQLEQERSVSRGRVQSLENRLDEMHKTWSGMLEQALSGGGAGHREISESLAALRQELDALRRHVGEAAERSESGRAELWSRSITDLGRELRERLAEADRRRADESALQARRLDALEASEKETRGTFERLAQTLLEISDRGREELGARLENALAELRAGLAEVSSRQTRAGENLSAMSGLAESLRDTLARPPETREQIIHDLQQEKTELLGALRERGDELRSYAIERRGVERSLGDSLLESTRELEQERARFQKERARAEELELSVAALRAELKRRDHQAQEAAERARIIEERREALAQELKARCEQSAQDEARLLEARRALDIERRSRENAEQLIADLRRQMQSLTEHLARVVSAHDPSNPASWEKERAELADALRRKDEWIAMLSATFQGLLQKP